MQNIIIHPDILKIHFVHEQQDANSYFQIPSDVLEKVLKDYVKSLQGGITVPLENT